jgi:hypothetical protein
MAKLTALLLVGIFAVATSRNPSIHGTSEIVFTDPTTNPPSKCTMRKSGDALTGKECKIRAFDVNLNAEVVSVLRSMNGVQDDVTALRDDVQKMKAFLSKIDDGVHTLVCKDKLDVGSGNQVVNFKGARAVHGDAFCRYDCKTGFHDADNDGDCAECLTSCDPGYKLAGECTTNSVNSCVEDPHWCPTTFDIEEGSVDITSRAYETELDVKCDDPSRTVKITCSEKKTWIRKGHCSAKYDVTCLAEAHGVCVVVNTNPNWVKKNSRAAHEHCRAQGARLCYNDELQVACENNLVTRNHWAWMQGGEGNDNQEAVGMYLSNCQNDDFSRNDNNGGVICCRNSQEKVDAGYHCNNGKEISMDDQGTAACETWNGIEQGQGNLNFGQCAKFCRGRGERMCNSPESFAMCKTGHWTDNSHAGWINGGEGDNNQEYMGRFGSCQVDDWPKHQGLHCNCCKDFIPPVTKEACTADGNTWSDRSGTCFTGLHGHGNFQTAINKCASTGSRMCHNHEIRTMLDDGTITGCNHAIWTDGGEGDNNQEESGVYCNQATDDWPWTTGSLHAACCISGDVPPPAPKVAGEGEWVVAMQAKPGSRTFQYAANYWTTANAQHAVQHSKPERRC